MARTVQDITVQPSQDEPGKVLVRMEFERGREWVYVPADVAFRAGMVLIKEAFCKGVTR